MELIERHRTCEICTHFEPNRPCNHPQDPVEYCGESCKIVRQCEDDLQKIFEENKYFPLFPNYEDAQDYGVKHPNLWTLKYWEELVGDGSDYWDGMWTFMANKCKCFEMKKEK